MIQPFVAEYLRKECGDLNEVASDNDDDKDDDDANSKGVEVVEIGTDETLTMLDRLVNLKYQSKEKRNFLSSWKTNQRRKECWKNSKTISMFILC